MKWIRWKQNKKNKNKTKQQQQQQQQQKNELHLKNFEEFQKYLLDKVFILNRESEDINDLKGINWW